MDWKAATLGYIVFSVALCSSLFALLGSLLLTGLISDCEIPVVIDLREWYLPNHQNWRQFLLASVLMYRTSQQINSFVAVSIEPRYFHSWEIIFLKIYMSRKDITNLFLSAWAVCRRSTRICFVQDRIKEFWALSCAAPLFQKWHAYVLSKY